MNWLLSDARFVHAEREEEEEEKKGAQHNSEKRKKKTVLYTIILYSCSSSAARGCLSHSIQSRLLALSTNFCLSHFFSSCLVNIMGPPNGKYLLGSEHWQLYNISILLSFLDFLCVRVMGEACKSLQSILQTFIRFPILAPHSQEPQCRSTAADHLTADPFIYFFYIFHSF